MRLARKALIWQAVRMGGVKVISLVRIMILARLLTPEDFGLVAIAATAMSFLLNLTDFGMIPALVQGDEMEDSQFNAAWTIGISRSAVISIFMFVSAPLIARIFAEPGVVIILQVMSLNPILAAFTSIKVASLNRGLLFRPLAMLHLVSALMDTFVSIIFAIIFGVWGLVIGTLAGTATTVVASYILAPHRPRLLFDLKASRSLIHFGRWIFITSLITMAGSYLLRVVISRQVGVAGLGLYYLASQLAFLPAEVASELVGNVAFPLYSHLKNDITRATRVFRAMVSSLAAILYPACTVIMVLAPGLVQDVLGPEWAGTEQAIRVLALVALIGIYGEATVPVFKGFGQPYRITLLELIQSTVLIALGWVLTKQYGLVGAALAWLPAISLSLLLNVSFISQILDRPMMGMGRPLWAILAIAAIGAAIAGALYSLIPGLIGIFLAGSLAVLAVCFLLWISDRRFSFGFMRNLAWIFPQVATLTGVQSIDN